MELKDLLTQIKYEADAFVASEEDGALPHEFFLDWCIGELEEIGETEDLVLSNFNEKGQAVHGYTYSDHDNRLDLFLTHYENTNQEYTLYKSDCDTFIQRLKTFVKKTLDGKNIGENQEPGAYGLIDLMQKKVSEITLIRIFLLTNGKTTIQRTEDVIINEINVQTHIWDITRFLRFRSSGEYIENTDILVKDYNVEHISCSSTTDSSEVETQNFIKTYLCVFKGDFLADIYFNFTSRLLERNVRAFLSFKSQVNRGIFKTIADEPDKFIAYNNGLTATATKIEINNDQTKISKIYGLQIVNGGQTTNSIYRAKYSEKLDIKDVFVPVKLCVLPEDDLDEFGSKISKFANTQNAIKRTDLTSNHPVYRELEKLSRSVIAPARDGSQLETKWFFERARGQYMDELSKLSTPAKKKAYERLFPRKQKFDKSLLCRFWGTWYQQIEDVSQGPEKYHPLFIDDLDQNKNKFDAKNSQVSYQKLISMAIIYNDTKKRVRELKCGYSYPTNVAEYTISLISNLSGMKVDLVEIWKRQGLTEEFIKNIDYIAPIVGDTIRELTEGGFIPREIAKGKKVKGKNLWNILLDKNLELPAEFKINENSNFSSFVGTGRVPLTNEQQNAVLEVEKYSADELWALATWAKETNNLAPWQRSIVGSSANIVTRGKKPSPKQAVQVINAMKKALELGFKFS